MKINFVYFSYFSSSLLPIVGKLLYTVLMYSWRYAFGESILEVKMSVMLSTYK